MHTRTFLVSTILLVVSATCLVITVSPPPPRKYVSQTWVAFSSDDNFSIRLALQPDGTGSGVLLPYKAPPEPFNVTSWDYDVYSLTLSVHFRNPKIGISTINGEFKHRVTSYVSSMLPNPERLSAGWLPGPLELSFSRGESQVRFSAWPENELEETLKSLRGSPVR